jgi:hypothetical protein
MRYTLWPLAGAVVTDRDMYRHAAQRGKVAVVRTVDGATQTRIGILIAWKPRRATGGTRNVARVDFGNEWRETVRLNTYTVVPA